MSGIDASIALPEDETPGELIKGYYTLMRAFGWDLYVTCHFELKDSLGPQWFAARISELKAADPRNWHPNHRFDPQDPGVVLRDYVHEPDSPYVGVFGGQFQKVSAARKILGTRNTWFHFGEDPTAAQLIEAAKVVRGFVLSSNMHIGGRIERLLARLDDLRTGRYPGISPATDVVAEPQPERRLATPADMPRPRIGGTWLGVIPSLRYRITRAGDIVHPETMESVRARVVGDFEERARGWLAVEPRGHELWIDDDGAIGGFIGATPRLLGYLGADPGGEVARGFFTSHFYMVDGSDAVDLDTGARLPLPAGATVRSGTTLRVTTYGDLLVIDDENGVDRVAVVQPNDWFPGHLS